MKTSRALLIAARGALWGLGAALTGAAPAAFRIAGADRTLPAVWFAIAGLLAVPSVLAVIAAELAREAWRALPRDRKETLVAWGGIGLVLYTPLLVAAGAALKASTHHRGLGGATYGAFAAAALVMAALVTYRVVDWLVRVVGARWASWIGVGVVALALTAALVLGARLLAGAGAGTLTARAQVGVVDAGVWLFAIVVGGYARTPARIGGPLGAIAVGAGVALLGSAAVLPARSPALFHAIRDGAPIASPMSELMGER